MHKQIEDYLNEVAKALGTLPAARRDEELRELRQHLLNAIAVNRETGQTEAEAVASALAQFGGHKEVGQSVVSAWRRERMLTWRSFWGATICTLVMYRALMWLLGPIWYSGMGHEAQSHQAGFWGHGAFVIVPVGINIVVGLVSGLVFPKKAVAGTALIAMGLAFLDGAKYLLSAYHFPYGVFTAANGQCVSAFTQAPSLVAATFCMEAINLVSFPCVAILTAWFVSQRQAAKKQMRQPAV